MAWTFLESITHVALPSYALIAAPFSFDILVFVHQS